MKDERDELLDRLFASARAEKPDTASVEAHFETRLMARIEEQRTDRLFHVWTWRLLPWFATIATVVAVTTLFYEPTRSSDIFAPLTNGYEEYQLTSRLAGD